MTTKLNEEAVIHAKRLIAEGQFVADRRADWSEHQPSASEENEFIASNGIEQYALWHLGIDHDKHAGTKGRFTFPYGNFVSVHRCALISAEGRAGQYKHFDIEAAAVELRELIDLRTG